MSEHGNESKDKAEELPPSVENWSRHFMEAAEHYEIASSFGWRRRLLVPLVALLVLATTGVAVAAIAGRLDGPELPPYRGETHAFLDLDTGEPIRCPDGSLLTYTPPAGSTVYADPVCPDGSVPAVYERQLEALVRFTESAEFGSSAAEGPRFAYELGADPDRAECLEELRPESECP